MQQWREELERGRARPRDDSRSLSTPSGVAGGTESAGGDASSSHPPPSRVVSGTLRGSFAPPGPAEGVSWTEALHASESVRVSGVAAVRGWSGGMAAVAGILITGAIVLIGGFPPSLDPPSPFYTLVPLAGALIARRNEGGNTAAILGSVVAALAGVVTFVVLVTTLGILDFLNCWMTWLADC